MSAIQASRSAPAVPVELVVHPALRQLTDGDYRLNRALRSRVSTGLGQVLRRLGIPGSPSVKVRAGDDDNRWGWVSVNNQRCRSPEEFPRRVQTYVRGEHGGAEGDSNIASWLEGLLSDPDAAVTALAYCRTATTEIVKRRPSVLLGPGQADAYARGLATRIDSEWLHEILRRLLELKVSIGDRRVISRELEAARDAGPGEALERLLPKLRPGHVEVRLPEAYLRQLTLDTQGEVGNLFGRFREQILDELGISCSPLRAVVDDGLPPQTFAVVINHLRLLPWVGLDPDETLVARPPTEAALAGLDVLGPAMNPRTGVQNARVGRWQRRAAMEAGWSNWDPLEFLTLALRTDLEDNVACLIDVATTGRQIDRFATYFPALVEAVGERLPTWRLTSLLRRLVDDGIRVQDCWLVLERLLDADHLDIGDDERLAAWTRLALVPATVDQYARGGTIGVYVIDTEMEQLLRRGGSVLVERDQERILLAIAQALRVSTESDAPAVVLTAGSVTNFLRHAVAEEFPRLAIFSHSELPPRLRIRSDGRIRLPP